MKEKSTIPEVDSKWAGAFDWNPDKGRIVHDQNKAMNVNGKGSSPRHNLRNYAKGLKGIDWTK